MLTVLENFSIPHPTIIGGSLSTKLNIRVLGLWKMSLKVNHQLENTLFASYPCTLHPWFYKLLGTQISNYFLAYLPVLQGYWELR